MTIELPQPIGDYVVGLTTTEFVYPDGAGTPRRIHVTIYYPADSTEGKPSAPYAFPELSGRGALAAGRPRDGDALLSGRSPIRPPA